MSRNHKKYTLVIIDEYSRYTWVHFLRNKSQAAEMIMSFIKMVKNQNDIKVKQIRTNNGTEFRNSELKSFVMRNISGLKQSGLPITLRMDQSLSKDMIRLHVKYSEKGSLTSATFMCLDVLSFRVFNTRRQRIKKTYHVTFYESMEAIRFTNTLIDKIIIDDSTRYPPNEFLYEDDLSRQYQEDFDISYYITPHNCLLTKLIKDTHVPEVITPNEQNTPHTEDVEGPPDLISTEGTQE
ncbi:retrovirus-related pol polyprotein from transposon TNT 1-94 [Tanacetum coccineum]